MGIDLSILVGGEAGQGIQTVGQLLTSVCLQSGLYLFAINDYESRIRGGHSFFQIRISSKKVEAHHQRIHLLVALNRETIELHRPELVKGGVVIADQELGIKGENILSLPILKLAQQAGAKAATNTAAVGVVLSLLGGQLETLISVVSGLFEKKGEGIVAKNRKAAELGYGAAQGHEFKWAFNWEQGRPKGKLMQGNQSIALGALAGDCRMAAFYPMSPATGIMVHLEQLRNEFPLVVEQAEDEIAAINMAIGASFSGVRSMTATSGGGFCLMTEGLGLSGITETPLVIVDAQRPGPATGLPTRTAQGDLLFVIHASQDEFPRFVFAPGSPQEAYETTRKAFHLADKYQVPAIILVDHHFSSSLYLVEEDFIVPETVEHFTITDADLTNPGAYKRFALTETGVSPRALPCNGKALVVVSGNEHSEDGHISEKIEDRVAMVRKRNAKIPLMLNELDAPQVYHGEADILLVGWGTTKGAIREAVDKLRAEKMDVGSIHLKDLWPFPEDKIAALIGNGKRFYMVEQNSSAQCGQLIREQTGIKYTGTVLKYDGRPFSANEIEKSLKEQL